MAWPLPLSWVGDRCPGQALAFSGVWFLGLRAQSRGPPGALPGLRAWLAGHVLPTRRPRPGQPWSEVSPGACGQQCQVLERRCLGDWSGPWVPGGSSGAGLPCDEVEADAQHAEPRAPLRPTPGLKPRDEAHCWHEGSLAPGPSAPTRSRAQDGGAALEGCRAVPRRQATGWTGERPRPLPCPPEPADGKPQSEAAPRPAGGVRDVLAPEGWRSHPPTPLRVPPGGEQGRQPPSPEAVLTTVCSRAREAGSSSRCPVPR